LVGNRRASDKLHHLLKRGASVFFLGSVTPERMERLSGSRTGGAAIVDDVRLVTGYGREEHRARSRAQGFTGYFLEPVRSEELRAALSPTSPPDRG
jgi:hypothetical protein